MVSTTVNSSNNSLSDHNPYDRTATGSKESHMCDPGMQQVLT